MENTIRSMQETKKEVLVQIEEIKDGYEEAIEQL